MQTKTDRKKQTHVWNLSVFGFLCKVELDGGYDSVDYYASTNMWNEAS